MNPVRLINGFNHQLHRHPNKTAFALCATEGTTEGNTALTYDQLSRMADDVVRSLGLDDVKRVESGHPDFEHSDSGCPESRYENDHQYLIGWCGDNHPDLAVLYVALTRADQIIVLLDPAWPEALREKLLAQLGVHQLISPGNPPEKLQLTAVDLRQNGNQAGNNPFLIGFTSGSTAEPKAFIRSQRSWHETFVHAAHEFGLSDSDIVLAPGPLSHGLSFYAMAETLNFGGTFHAMDRFDPVRCLQLIAQSSVTSLVVVPTMLVAIMEAIEKDRLLADLARASSGLTRVISAGSKLSPAVRKALQSLFFNAEIIEYYGASELSFVSVSHQRENQSAQSVGRAFSGVQLSIRNQDGETLEPLDNGLVHVKSDLLAEGYLTGGNSGDIRPLDGVGDWKTVGDLGYLDQNGTLFLTDRENNMLITGGLNVYPAEIENVLRQCQSVQECIVVGIADIYWGDRIVAVVRKNGTANLLTDQSLRKFCESMLSSEKIPRNFYGCETWPMTTSGKIDRRQLKRWLENDQGSLIPLPRETTNHDQ